MGGWGWCRATQKGALAGARARRIPFAARVVSSSPPSSQMRYGPRGFSASFFSFLIQPWRSARTSLTTFCASHLDGMKRRFGSGALDSGPPS